VVDGLYNIVKLSNVEYRYIKTFAFLFRNTSGSSMEVIPDALILTQGDKCFMFQAVTHHLSPRSGGLRM
jgi:DNA gyrase inhibitor GyrI